MYLLIYAFALIVIVGLSFAAYKLCACWGRIPAAIAATLTLSASILIWPIPIHGGFTFLLDVAWRELNHKYIQHQELKQTRIQNEFLAKLSQRFKGPLDVHPRQRLNSNWYEVQTQSGSRAWLDESSKMLWSELLLIHTTTNLPSLERAKAACSTLSPEGYWALPTEAENYTLWHSGGANVLPRFEYNMISYTVDEQFRLELPTYAMGKKSNNANMASQHGNAFAVRCIARTKDAPIRGYIKSDIALDDWNEYQLRKLIR
jgi:hypothetical protein